MGHFREAEGTISAPIGRHPVDRKKMCVTEKIPNLLQRTIL